MGWPTLVGDASSTSSDGWVQAETITAAAVRLACDYCPKQCREAANVTPVTVEFPDGTSLTIGLAEGIAGWVIALLELIAIVCYKYKQSIVQLCCRRGRRLGGRRSEEDALETQDRALPDPGQAAVATQAASNARSRPSAPPTTPEANDALVEIR